MQDYVFPCFHPCRLIECQYHSCFHFHQSIQNGYISPNSQRLLHFFDDMMHLWSSFFLKRQNCFLQFLRYSRKFLLTKSACSFFICKSERTNYMPKIVKILLIVSLLSLVCKIKEILFLKEYSFFSPIFLFVYPVCKPQFYLPTEWFNANTKAVRVTIGGSIIL